MRKMTPRPSYHTPSLLKTCLEARWPLELAAHYSSRHLLSQLPKGDGHSVIVFPGFLTSELSTRPLRGLLSRLCYSVHDWGFGRNLRFNEGFEKRMIEMVKAKCDKTGTKVTLLGWSLGGVFAREIARAIPSYIRNTVSLGSPISGARNVAIAGPIYEYLNGKPDHKLQTRIECMRFPPPVPTSSIYSKSDGIVHWKGALQKTGELSENIRVPASHLGMGSNPLVMYVIADRLCQKVGEWSPFEAQGLRRFIFTPKAA